MLTGINHITFAVSNLEASLHFYVNLLGMELVERWEKGAYLLAGQQWVALNFDSRQDSKVIPHDSHIAFSVSTENWKYLETKLIEQGITAYRENRSEGNSFYFLDPDGHKLEIHDSNLCQRRMAMNLNKPWISKPDEALKSALTDYYFEYQKSGETLYQDLYKGIVENFEAYIHKLKDQENGKQLPDDWAKTTTLFLIHSAEVLGTVRIRHDLTNDFLKNFIGHIGYDVKPSARHKGNGSLLLKAGLDKARQIGLQKVLILCEKNNLASKAIIIKHGGTFESEIVDSDGHCYLRFWIIL